MTEPRSLKRLILAIIALLFAWLGQSRLAGSLVSDGVILYALAGVMFVGAFARTPVAQLAHGHTATPATERLKRRQWVMLALSALATLLSVTLFASNNAPGAWLLHAASVILFVAAFIRLSRIQRPAFKGRQWTPGIRGWARRLAPIVVVLALALCARVWQLDQFPFGTWYDEATNALEAVRILQDGNYRPVYMGSTQMPAHFDYLVAFAFQLLGVNTTAIRLISAAFGLLSVLFAYLLFRRWMGERMGLVAAALLAVLRYSLTFSRFGMQAIATPTFELAFLYFLARALEHKKFSDVAWMGLTLGFGLSFYFAIRLFPAALAVFALGALLVALLRRRAAKVEGQHTERQPLLFGFSPVHLVVFVYAGVVAFAPVIQFAIQHSDTFFKRTGAVSIFEQRDEPDLAKALLSNTQKHLLMFNVLGDRNARHNLPNEPLLDPIMGMLFVLGLAYSLWRWRDPPNFLMLLIFFILLLGGILSLDFEAPQSLRSIGIIPALVYFITVPLAAIGAEIGRVFRARTKYQAYPENNRTVQAPKSSEPLLVNSNLSTMNAEPVRAGPSTPRRPLTQLEMRMGAYQGRTATPATNQPTNKPLNEPTNAPAQPPRRARQVTQLEMRMGAFQRRAPTSQPTNQPTRQAVYPPADKPAVRFSFYSLVLVALLALISYSNFDTFFNRQKNSPAVWAEYSTAETIVAREMNRLAPTHAIVLSSLYDGHPTVRFLAPNVSVQRRWTVNDHLPLTNDPSRSVALLLDPLLVDSYQEARRYYPGAQFQGYHAPAGGGTVMYESLISSDDLRSVQGVVANYFKGDSFEGAPAATVALPQLMVDWTNTQPISGSFSAEFRSTLNVPQYGDYRFSVRGANKPTLLLDENPVGDAALTLAAGNHSLRLRVTGGASQVELWWQGPAAPQTQPIPANALFRAPVTNNGLLGAYYASGNWSGPPAFMRVDPEIALYFQDIPLPRPYTVEWKGKIYAPTTGSYRFGVDSRDDSRLSINDQQVIDNRGGALSEGAASMTQGWNDITLRFGDRTSHTQIYLYWTSPGGSREIVPSYHLSPPMGQYPAAAEVEALRKSVPAAAPTTAPPEQPSGQPAAVPAGSLTLTPVQVVGVQGSGPAQFKAPHAVGVGSDGRIFVVDTGNKRVQILDEHGEFIAALEGGSAKFVDPFDIVVASSGEFVVLDSDEGWLYRFDQDGKPLGRVAGPTAQFYHARGLSIDAEGNLYVADTGGSRVVKLSPTGQRLQVFGTKGTGKGQFSEPSSAVMDGLGFLYATDVTNKRIEAYSADGKFALDFPIPLADPHDGPHIAFAPDQTLLVTAPEPHKIQRYSREGKLLGEWGGPGTQLGQFRQPTGITIHGNTLWIADTANNRIQQWEVK